MRSAVTNLARRSKRAFCLYDEKKEKKGAQIIFTWKRGKGGGGIIHVGMKRLNALEKEREGSKEQEESLIASRSSVPVFNMRRVAACFERFHEDKYPAP